MRASLSPHALRHRKVVITAGPTREYWDPVRFLTNASSGQMGIALAMDAVRRGASVTLILGPISGMPPRHPRLQVVPVLSALDMRAQVRRAMPGASVFIGAAAVADYRPAAPHARKIKEKSAEVTLRLVRNPDILAGVAQAGKTRPSLVVGFALETHRMMAHAELKLTRKGADWIVANRVSNLGAGKGTVTLLSRRGERVRLPSQPKSQLAKRIWTILLESGIG